MRNFGCGRVGKGRRDFSSLKDKTLEKESDLLTLRNELRSITKNKHALCATEQVAHSINMFQASV